MSITRTQYAEAMAATDAIAVAADLIMQASKLLDKVPGRFRSLVEDVDGTDAIDTSLAFALDKLASQICTEADSASELAL